MSQLNHNVEYIYTVDGFTVWEKLRVIRNFLQERKEAKDNVKEGVQKNNSDVQKDILDDCEREVKFLKKMESFLAQEAEKTRVPGYDDKDMYEVNFFQEMVERDVFEAKSEIASMGHVTPQTMRSLMKCEPALRRMVNEGFLNENMLSLANSSKPESIKCLTSGNSSLLIEEQKFLGESGE